MNTIPQAGPPITRLTQSDRDKMRARVAAPHGSWRNEAMTWAEGIAEDVLAGRTPTPHWVALFALASRCERIESALFLAKFDAARAGVAA